MEPETRTRLALAGVLAVTLYSFSNVFAPGGYPGPALLGMVLAAGISHGGHRMGLRAAAGVIASAAALVAYLALIFEAPLTFYGLPTIAAARALVANVAEALRFVDVDYAPVVVRTGYVILTVVGMWMCTAIADMATFRWRRPVVAILPCIGIFTMLMVVGTGMGTALMAVLFLSAVLTFLAVESAHRLSSWGSWLTAWGRRGDAAPITSATARRMGASCVVVALFTPVFLPAIGDGLVSWRSGAAGPGLGSGNGGRATGEINPLVSLAPRLLRQDDTELFRVQPAVDGRRTYWRLATLEAFDGVTWSEAGGEATEIPDPRLASLGRVMPESVATFTITGLRGEPLPVPSDPRGVEVLGADRDLAAAQLRFESDTNDYRLIGGVSEGLRYRVGSVDEDVTFRQLRRAEPQTRGPDEPALGNPTELSPRVRALLEEWTAGIDNGFERLVSIQDHLRLSYAYTERPAADPDDAGSQDYLETFLLDTRAGYCQQFSTAFALLAGQLGYRTRVVVGFLPGENVGSPVGPPTFAVKGTDAHAWPEVDFGPELGWIPFEPTPRTERAANAPGYTQAGGPGRGVERAFNQVDGLQGGARAADRRQEADEAFDRPPATAEGSDASSAAAGRDSAWRERFRRVARWLLALGLAFLVSVPLLKRWRVASRYRRATDPGSVTEAAFAEFEHEASELAVRRAPAESPTRYALRVAAHRRIPVRPALRLAALYEAAEYSRGGAVPGMADEARRLARQLRSRLWARASWWDRVMRLFSPASLRSGNGATGLARRA